MRITADTAVEKLKNGCVVALPTETVYGLAACYNNGTAVEEIFFLKGRPRQNPLILHIADREQLTPFVKELPNGFEALAAAFWPGPLTLVLPVIASTVPTAVRAGLPTAAFRLPNSALAREIIRQTGPLVMPSANLSGLPTATSAEHVEEDFGGDFPVVDGGSSSRGVESTILIHHEGCWVLGRYGAVTPAEISKVIGEMPVFLSGSEPLCPGRLFRHYAPRARLLLSDSEPSTAYSAILGYSGRDYPTGARLLLLGGNDDPSTVAANLYAALRALDTEGHECVWVDSDAGDGSGLWLTIFDRLKKAAEKGEDDE